MIHKLKRKMKEFQLQSELWSKSSIKLIEFNAKPSSHLSMQNDPRENNLLKEFKAKAISKIQMSEFFTAKI